MKKVFISHSSLDREFVDQEIVSPLERHGIDTWYSHHDIQLASEWDAEIRQGLESCDWFLLVLSPRAVDSRWVKAEVQWAVDHRWSRIAIVSLEAAEVDNLNLLLRQIQRIDYNDDFPAGRKQLASWLDLLTKEGSDERIILTILGAKGGVGKSTIACRMAEMIAETGHNVLIVDLDTGASGSTTLQRERGSRLGGSSSTYDILLALAEGAGAPVSRVRPLEVTPDYLAEQKDFGRVFLLPAVPLQQFARTPTEDLLRRLLPRRNASDSENSAVVTTIMDNIMASADALPVSVNCVILDCGAEGAEFNPLVAEAHRRATLTYIVVQPEAISRENVSRVSHLLTRDGHAATSGKLRVIINRVYSSQHEEVAKNQFSDYDVAGCIPDDRQLFEDTQKGRVNHRYGYDAFSQAVRQILAHGHDLPQSSVPDEVDLWARPAARLVVERGPLALLNKQLRKRDILAWVTAVFIGLFMLSYNGLRVVQRLSDSPGMIHEEKVASALGAKDLSALNLRAPRPADGLEDSVRQAMLLHILFAVLGGFMLFSAMSKLVFWGGRIALVFRLQKIIKSAAAPRSDVEVYLCEISRDDSYRQRLEWLRGAIAGVRQG